MNFFSGHPEAVESGTSLKSLTLFANAGYNNDAPLVDLIRAVLEAIHTHQKCFDIRGADINNEIVSDNHLPIDFDELVALQLIDIDAECICSAVYRLDGKKFCPGRGIPQRDVRCERCFSGATGVAGVSLFHVFVLFTIQVH